MCCELLLIETVWIPLHMMELNQPVELMTTEENHGSRQGTQESVPQSGVKDEKKNCF